MEVNVELGQVLRIYWPVCPGYNTIYGAYVLASACLLCIGPRLRFYGNELPVFNTLSANRFFACRRIGVFNFNDCFLRPVDILLDAM